MYSTIVIQLTIVHEIYCVLYILDIRDVRDLLQNARRNNPTCKSKNEYTTFIFDAIDVTNNGPSN